MKLNRILGITVVAVIAGAIAGFGILRFGAQQVRAFNPQPDPPGYGFVGITQGQTIRINVVNTTPPDPNLPPDPVRVVITFRDTDGNLFRNAEGVPIRRAELLQAGKSDSIDLNGDSFARMADVTGRIQVRPVVQIQQADPIDGHPPDPCIPTVEIFNNANGRTQFMVPFVPVVQRSSIPQ